MNIIDSSKLKKELIENDPLYTSYQQVIQLLVNLQTLVNAKMRINDSLMVENRKHKKIHEDKNQRGSEGYGLIKKNIKSLNTNRKFMLDVKNYISLHLPHLRNIHTKIKSMEEVEPILITYATWVENANILLQKIQ